MFVPSAPTHPGTSRWRLAQQYEQSFWRRQGTDIDAGARSQFDWYKWRADQLARRLIAIPGAPLGGRVLEIGCGPIGIISFLEWGHRFGIDPLEHFYRTQPSLVSLRSREVTYLDGTGESLPFQDGTFSLVILDNVIDHTSSPPAILQQIARVLDPAGLLYLSVNVHTPWGAFLHTLIADLLIDKGHPHTFTSGRLGELLSMGRFAVLNEHVDSFSQSARADRHSAKMTDRIKGFTGMSEFPHSVICGKTS